MGLWVTLSYIKSKDIARNYNLTEVVIAVYSGRGKSTLGILTRYYGIIHYIIHERIMRTMLLHHPIQSDGS